MAGITITDMTTGTIIITIMTMTICIPTIRNIITRTVPIRTIR